MYLNVLFFKVIEQRSAHQTSLTFFTTCNYKCNKKRKRSIFFYNTKLQILNKFGEFRYAICTSLDQKKFKIQAAKQVLKSKWEAKSYASGNY